MKSMALLCVVMVFWLVFSGQAFGEANLSYETYSYHEGPQTHDFQSFTASDKVIGGNFSSCLGGGCGLSGGAGFASGYADSTQLKMGIKTSAGSNMASWGASSNATVSIVNTFTILENTTQGLYNGDVVPMHLTMRMDGLINVSSSADAHGQAELGIFNISDRDISPGSEFTQPEVAYFSAKWDVNNDYLGQNSLFEWQANKITSGFWGAHGTLLGEHKYPNWHYNQCTVGDPSCYYAYTPSGPGGTYSSLDTSALVIHFDAVVGQTYTLYGNLTNLSEADGVASSNIDFPNTFAGIVKPDNLSIVLDWGVPLTPLLYASFTGNGLYKYDDTTWARIDTVIPENMVASGSTLYATYAGLGLYKYDGSTWSRIDTVIPENMVASGSTLYATYAGLGLYKYDGSTWSRIDTVIPENMVASGSTLYATYAGLGLYKYDGSTWSRIDTVIPENMVASGLTLYATYTGIGLYKYDGSTWSSIDTVIPEHMVASGSTLYATYAGIGLYKYDGSTWSRIDTVIPENMVASGLTLYATYTGIGLYKYDGTTWTRIDTVEPASMAAGQ